MRGRPGRAARFRERLGRYKILHELGKGAMGVVYRARDPTINREVALKAIPLAAEFEGDELEEARAKFFREAEMAGRLSHPHIVTIYDAGEDRGIAYIAMELLRGRHLVEYTDASRLLPTHEALEIVARLADALHYAHQQPGRPSRHQAGERDVRPAERRAQDHRLRHRAAHRLEPHAHRRRARHAVVHVARAARRGAS